MRTPLLLFLKDSQEIRLFRSMKDLESSIEAVDVINEEYEAFDAEGRRINLVVNQHGAPTGLAGSIEEDAARALILAYYAAVNPTFRPSMTLPELVSALAELYSYHDAGHPDAGEI